MRQFTIVLFLMTLAACKPEGSSSEPYSEGSRAGVVTKLSRKGIRADCKTWEGELLMGGARDGADGVAQANVWAFTVPNDGPVKDVQAALDSGERVRLTYKQFNGTIGCGGDTEYKITAVTSLRDLKK